MAKVAQITMSRIINYGSILQAYALQHVIESIPGCTCETIDYLPQQPKAEPNRGLFRRLFDGVRHEVVYGRRDRSFQQMRVEDIHSTRPYSTLDDLRSEPPEADIYLTGSDQTFNPVFTHGDPAYFLSFLSDRDRASFRKIAYAASFAQRMSVEWRQVYRKALLDYDNLSIREKAGADFARELTGREVAHCCDPTLLMTRDEWGEFAGRATRRIRTPYILCYNLAYMVNPYPMANQVEREIQRQLQLPIVFLSGSKADYLKKNSKVIKSATPYEFVDLFLNAAFIMTSSYHGTAFALQSGKPFLTYVHADENADSRALDLLRRCGALQHALAIASHGFKAYTIAQFSPTEEEQCALRGFRGSSMDWLRRVLI